MYRKLLCVKKVVKQVDSRKVYCDECKYLKERAIMAEVPADSGEYAQTGKRFFCEKHKKWWAINTTFEMVGFSYCTEGEKNLINKAVAAACNTAHKSGEAS